MFDTLIVYAVAYYRAHPDALARYRAFKTHEEFVDEAYQYTLVPDHASLEQSRDAAAPRRRESRALSCASGGPGTFLCREECSYRPTGIRGA